MKKLISLVVLFVFFSSCSEYQRVLKEEDVAAKFKMGTELYDAGK